MTATFSAPSRPRRARAGAAAPPPAVLRLGLCAALLAGLLGACASDGRSPRPTSSLSEEELTERWTALATPGEHHAHLAAMEGDWHARTKSWMLPDAEPRVSEGYSRNRMILGGRFLQSEYLGDIDGHPLEGVSLIGYDNARGEYATTWYENTNTAIAPLSAGRCDGTGRVFTFETPRFLDPLSGQLLRLTQVIRIVSPDEHVYELWTAYPGQPRYRSLEIVYTRLESDG